ncbi:MAG: ABC transporter substrate-binding protein [Bacteroidia bacterium]|nr:ABC transporter substrate-binding protein [Bacteroidia bacterium]
MRLNFYLYLFAGALFFLVACSNNAPSVVVNPTPNPSDSLVGFAKRFNIQKKGNVYLLSIFGNRQTWDTTAKFALSDDTNQIRKSYKADYVVKIPCQKIAALSSIYAAVVAELGELNHLAAIDNIDYVTNEEILKKHQLQQLKELAKTPAMDVEQTVALQPDIVFTFGMGQGERDKDRRMIQTGIPVAISVDHLEETPLARAEWIKFFAVFMNKLNLADSIFNQVKNNYTYLKGLARLSQTAPTVFSEIKYSEFWYMPGGKSFMATLMSDAGASYLWKDNADFGSLPLSFEQVYAKANNADYWINLSSAKTKEELLSGDSRYSQFKAFKQGKLFNNIKHCNSKGYSSYWETGMIYPNRILSDLIQIFHPELRAQVKNDLYYYIQLK